MNPFYILLSTVVLIHDVALLKHTPIARHYLSRFFPLGR